MNGRKIPEACLDHLQLKAENPRDLARFYCRTLKMEASEVDGKVLCQGPQRQILFEKGQKGAIGYGAFSFADSQDLSGFRNQLEVSGIPIGPSPTPLFDETAFSVDDSDGNRMVFGVGANEGEPPGQGLGARLQHLALRTTQLEVLSHFYDDRLGFFLADRVEDEQGDPRTCFFSTDPEHHTMAIFQADSSRLDHHSYELTNWNQIRDWADHFAALGIGLRWGPGRHGPGNNLFLFIEDPEGNWIELSTELEVLKAGRIMQIWPHAKQTLNLWGPAILRS